MRVLVSGMVAGTPGQGGASWAVLQYVLGLRRLGHDVWFVEPVDGLDGPRTTYFAGIVAKFGLEDRAALLRAGTRDTVGVSYRRLHEAARTVDLLVNVSGLLREPRFLEPIPLRVYLDLDPAFTQLWHAQAVDVGLDGHHRVATVGRLVGRAGCPVPTCGRDWIGTSPPVVLDDWRPHAAISYEAFTTVGNWRGYGSITDAGIRFGQRAHSMRELFQLPALTGATFMPALSIHPGEERDLRSLADNGWRLLDPTKVAATPSAYRRFVRGSRAELGVAKAGYVVSRCGWFSDRSACYLASGRPVLAQDTGFGEYLPTGEGLLSFRTVEEAAAGVEELRRDYPRHARAAHELASAHFDSDTVLAALLDAVMR